MPSLYVIAGHGAGDPGASGNGYDEAERVRVLARRMGEMGANVLDTSRNWFEDEGLKSVDLPADAQIVELHMDSGPSGAKGGHVIIKPGLQPDGYDLALEAFVTGMFPGRAEGIRSQGLANATRALNRGWGYRLLELGFITNEADVGTFNSHIDKIAIGIMAAFGSSGAESNGESDLKPIEIPGGTYSVYRLYNPNTGHHHFTSKDAERDGLANAGWTYEGIAWRGADTGAIVYRLYNPNSGDHMLTADFGEADGLVNAGWKYEGADFASAREGEPVHRLYNPNNGMHMFTTSAGESDGLIAAGWKYEGVAFYAVG